MAKQKKENRPLETIISIVIFAVIAFFVYGWLMGDDNILIEEGSKILGGGSKTCEWRDELCISVSIQNCEPMKTRIDTMTGFREWKINGKDGSSCKMVNVMEEMYGRVTKTCSFSLSDLVGILSFTDLDTANRYCK